MLELAVKLEVFPGGLRVNAVADIFVFIENIHELTHGNRLVSHCEQGGIVVQALSLNKAGKSKKEYKKGLAHHEVEV